MKSFASVLSLLPLVLLSPGIAYGAETNDWPKWRGPNGDGISLEKGWKATFPASGPKILWTTSVGAGCSSVVVSNGRVISMGNSGGQDNVIALDEKTGGESWKFSYPAPIDAKQYEGGPNGTPTVDEGKVFGFSKNGYVICVDEKTGTKVWENDLAKTVKVESPQWGLSSSPLIVGNLVVLNVGASGIALNKTSGAIVWNSGAAGAGYGTGVAFKSGNQTHVAIFSAKAMNIVNSENGDKIQSLPWNTSYDVNASTPIVFNNHIFVSSGYGTGCALIKIGSANPVWKNKNIGCKASNSSILYNGHLYGSNEDALACVDAGSGKLNWDKKGFGSARVLIADGKLFALSTDGNLAIGEASPKSFEPVSQVKVLNSRTWVAPVLANGNLYCKDNKGQIVCLDMK